MRNFSSCYGQVSLILKSAKNENYRAEKKSLQNLLSSTQAGPGRKVKQEQEEISRNHVPRLFLSSVEVLRMTNKLNASKAQNVPY